MAVMGVERARRLLPQGKGVSGDDWRRRHRGMLALLWVHVVGVPLYAIAEGYGVLHSLAEGSLLAIAALVAGARGLGRDVRVGATALGLLTASALLVHFSGGYIEFHFHFFVMIALLALYQHWLPFLLAIGYVFVHHGVAGTLDPGAVYNHPDAVAHPWKWAGIHGGFVLAAAAASVFTWRMAERERQRRVDVEYVTEATLARLPLVELLGEVLARVSDVIGADAARLWLVEGGELVVRTAHGHAISTEDGVPAPNDGISGVVASGEPVVFTSAAAAAVPLMVEGTAIGVLDVSASRPGQFGDEQVRMLQLVADRVAPSIDRARLYEREHHIANTLQRSLLPKRLPDIPGLSVAVRYRPAGEGLAAGGDWYDVMQLPGDRLAIAVGDVVGHGIDAASLMGQLRTGLRAYAAEDPGPEAVVMRLSSLLCDLDEHQIATLLYVELCLGTGELSYVCAAHPPPLLRAPGSGAIYLPDGRTTPLGVEPMRPIVTGKAELAPGGDLILYTDGLVERRGEILDVGLEELRRLVSESSAEDVERLSDAVLAGFETRSSSHDDVAVVVARREPRRPEQPGVRAAPRALSPA